MGLKQELHFQTAWQPLVCTFSPVCFSRLGSGRRHPHCSLPTLMPEALHSPGQTGLQRSQHPQTMSPAQSSMFCTTSSETRLSITRTYRLDKFTLAELAVKARRTAAAFHAAERVSASMPQQLLSAQILLLLPVMLPLPHHRQRILSGRL